MIYLYTFLSLAPLTGTITKEDLENLRIILSNVAFLHNFTNPILKYEEMILKLTKEKVLVKIEDCTDLN